jgi:hypothetical protein
MGQLKLYKKFYCATIIRTGATAEQNYVLIDPYALSANTFVVGTGATESSSLIESSLLISQESTGVYFADLNPYLYASDVTYDLVWYVNYTLSAPIKKISTRFRINVNTVTNQIEIDYLNTPLEIEILNSSIDIDVLGKY